MISRACRIATLSAGINLSLIGKGETLNRPADVLAAIPNPGQDNPVPVGGFIQEWWAASSRYGGRHNLGIVGGFVRNQHRPFLQIVAHLNFEWVTEPGV
jgi:hypothetical protein